MKIAVIGTGNVGKALGGSLARAGHDVTFAARDEAKTREIAAELGAASSPTAEAAARDAEVIVLAVPYGAMPAVAREIASAAKGKVVIDVSNPLKSDYSGLATEGGPSGAERLAEPLIDAHVVKAFNTLFASVQADPAALGSTVDALYATDDDEARTAITAIAESVGFRPIYVGPLTAARELEALAWLNIRLQMLTNGSWNTAFVALNPPEAATMAG
jgi:predicted dinucleotide-binding enzyme